MLDFDKTYTDSDFKQQIRQADQQWMAQYARREPDLDIDGLQPSLLSRLLGLFGQRPN